MKKYIVTMLLSLSALSPLSQAEECPQNPRFTINNYAAYATQMSEDEYGTITEIVDYLTNVEPERVLSVQFVGHSSEYGNSDFQAASDARALDVLSTVEAELLNRDIDPDTLPLEYYGKSIDCPIASNDTQEERAINRRVDVVISINKLPENTDVVDGVPTYKKLLNHTKANSKNKTTQCLTKHLKRDNRDHHYLNLKSINQILAEQGKPKKAIKKHRKNMQQQTQAAYKRMVANQSEKAIEDRFKRMVERKRRSLIQGIDALDAQANCQSKSVVAMRKYIIEQSETPATLYYCKPIQKRVKKMLQSIGNDPKGCGT